MTNDSAQFSPTDEDNRQRGLTKAMQRTAVDSTHVYEVRPCKDHRGVDLIFDALPFGRMWYGEPNAISNAIGYAMHRSRSHDAVIRVYDAAGNVSDTYKHASEFKVW